MNRSATLVPRGSTRARRRARPRGVRVASGPWWAPLWSLRGMVVAALVLSHVWRWHDITPGVATLRIGAISTVASWGYLALRPQWPLLSRALALPYIWLPLAWTAWIALGLTGAMDPERSWSFFTSSFLKTIAAFLFLLGFLYTFARVRALAAVHVLGAGVLTFFYVKSGSPRDWSPWPMFDPNDIAFHLAIAVPLALYLVLEHREGRRSWAAWLVPLFIGIGVLSSQSRGAFLAIAAGALYLLMTAKSIRLAYRILPPLALVLGLFLAPDAVQERLFTLTDLEQDYNTQSETGRLQIWERGLDYVEYRPILGVGILGFEVADRVLAPQAATQPFWFGKSAHNSLLQAAVETGVPGALLFLAAFLTAMYRMWRLRRRLAGSPSIPDRNSAVFADLLISAILIYLVGGFFLSQAYGTMPFTLLAMAAGLELSQTRRPLPRRRR